MRGCEHGACAELGVPACLGRLLGVVRQREQALGAHGGGAPARLAAEQEQQRRPREQALGLRVPVAHALGAEEVECRPRVERGLAVGALGEGGLRNLDEQRRRPHGLACLLVVARDLEQRLAWPRLDVRDERLERLRYLAVALPALAGRDGGPAVDELLQDGGVERDQVRTVAPPVVDVLERDQTPLLDRLQPAAHLALVQTEHAGEDERQEARALERTSLQQFLFLLAEQAVARFQRLEQVVGCLHRREAPP